jgi:hypothetical protein
VKLFNLFDRFRIPCALWQGPYGAWEINVLSEFEAVLLILPDRDAPVLTGKLIYTAITRARKRVEIWGDEELFSRAVAKRSERSSGLRDALWPRESGPMPQFTGSIHLDN